ncbi:LytR C-terminal domain-containing protein [bacterium]|nr:LytR C-terminal domain-containing protein [bacterium]
MNKTRRKPSKRSITKKRRSPQKKQQDTYKGLLSNVFIWALVIVNVFLIASFSSRFLGGDSSRAETNVHGSEGIAATATAPDEDVIPGTQLTVEILNGCGQPGVAGKVESYLRQKSCDVVATGNYQTYDVEKTFVIDRKHNGMVYGNEVAKKLGLPVNSNTIVPFMSPERQVHVTVVIGKDYKQLPPFKDHR